MKINLSQFNLILDKWANKKLFEKKRWSLEAFIYYRFDMQTITIIDYGMGNLWSVKSALEYLNYNTKISNSS